MRWVQKTVFRRTRWMVSHLILESPIMNFICANRVASYLIDGKERAMYRRLQRGPEMQPKFEMLVS